MKQNDAKLYLDLGNQVSLCMIYCPSGVFMMGSEKSKYPRDGGPKHEVNITTPFWMSETPITREQYRSVIDREYGGIYESSIRSAASQHNWIEAMEFCDALQQRVEIVHPALGVDTTADYQITLPTEEQWEYACRAGTNTRWFFGDNEDELADYAWFGRDIADFSPLPEVRQKKANPWGFYDLYGLVDEWCLNDIYIYTEVDRPPVTLVKRTDKGFVLKSTRGGFIDSASWMCTSAFRGFLDHWNSQNDLTGFRVVLTTR